MNAAGTAALGNVEAGILIGAAGNTIGGTTTAERNVIAGTVGWDCHRHHRSNRCGNDNLIEGNYIGTNAAGTAALPNGDSASPSRDGTGNTIGGATRMPGTGAGNVISGNADGGLETAPTDTDIVLGNIIGLDATGTAAVENGSSTNGNGISISTGSSNTIGGTAAGTATSSPATISAALISAEHAS